MGEDSQEAMSPDKVLAAAVEHCKNSKSAASRLNKSENDLSWWRDHTSPKPLKTVRKPADFLASSEAGENLADFIPQHKPSTQESTSQTPLSFRQSRPMMARSFYVSLGVNFKYFSEKSHSQRRCPPFQTSSTFPGADL